MNPVAQKYGAAHLAGINLIPVEIAERKKMRTAQTLAVLAVAIAIGVVIVGFLLFFATRQVAEGRVDDALSAQSAALQARDGKAPVFAAVRQREAEEYTLAQIGFGEIQYAQLTTALQSAETEDTSFDSIVVAGPNALGLGGGTQDELFRGGVGTFTFTARADSLESATGLIERLSALPGVAEVRGTSEAYASDGGDTFYQIDGGGVITDLRLTGRLTPEGGITGVDALAVVAEQDPGSFPMPTAEPTPTPAPSASEEG